MAIDLEDLEARFALLFASENEETFLQWRKEKYKKEQSTLIGYKCTADCILEGRRYEADDECMLEDAETEYNWPGTIFFENHPFEFEPIFK